MDEQPPSPAPATSSLLTSRVWGIIQLLHLLFIPFIFVQRAIDDGAPSRKPSAHRQSDWEAANSAAPFPRRLLSVFEEWTTGVAVLVVYFLLLGVLGYGSHRLRARLFSPRDREDDSVTATMEKLERGPGTGDERESPTPSRSAHEALIHQLYVSHPWRRATLAVLSILYITLILSAREVVSVAQTRKQNLRALLHFLSEAGGGGVLVGAWALAARFLYLRAKIWRMTRGPAV